MSWRWLTFERAVPHGVPASLHESLVHEMRDERAHELKADEPTTAINFDLPGMVSMTRPWRVVELEGVTLKIPSGDVGQLLGGLDRLPIRRFSDGLLYYKLRGFMRCLVLAPAHRQALLWLLRAIVDECEKEADAHVESILRGDA